MKKVFREKFNKYLFNDFIKQEMEESGFTQVEMGKLLDVSDRTISGYVKKRIVPSLTVFLRFCQVFNKKLLIMDKWDDITEIS